jgi:hypothetical protein
MMLRKLFVCFSLSFLFLLLGCASLARPELSPEEEAALYPLASYVPEVFEWEEVCPGISRFDFENSEIPLIYHAVRIDLTFAGAAGSDGTLELVCGHREAATRSESTAQFAARTQCAVAVNATPFTRSGKLAGIHKEAGVLLSQPVARYGAVAFKLVENGGVSRAGYGESGDLGQADEVGGPGCVARIFASQADEKLKDFEYAFGGFFVVLRDGLVCTDFIRRGDSRTGVGLSADGRILYFLVVEGEWPDRSRGLSYPQCGELFKAMGCNQALELDGGSSSDLCVNGKSVLSYKVHSRQVNSFGFRVK